MAKSREIEVFGLSFMDLISCGLGGMLVLMFIFSTLVNANGVATPTKAETKGKSVAELEREMIFNTQFTLKVVVDDQAISIKPISQKDLIIGSGIDRSGTKSSHLFMFNGSNKIVKKVTFQIDGGYPTGYAQILGKEREIIPDSTSIIQVIKDKTHYKLKFER